MSRGEEYEVTLRDDFQKILDLDFLPLLRINRHEIIQLALTGFDIYVDHEYIQIDPLKAILQVLNRVDGVKYAMKTEKGVRLQPNEHDSAWQSL